MISKILIIEDEKPNADRLKRLVKALRPQTDVVATLETITESVEWFESGQDVDMVLMDIRLYDGLSFEIFDKVNVSCPIIFTTAYDEYAVRAFKYNSFDYLLKPIEKEELLEAIEKVETNHFTKDELSIKGLLNFLQTKEYRSRFLLPYRDGYKTILTSDVVYFHSEQRISRAKLYDGTEEVIPQTMEELEQQLDPKRFFRANRQFIIHIDSIQQVNNYFNHKLKLTLKNCPEAEIIISREKATAFKNWLDY